MRAVVQRVSQASVTAPAEGHHEQIGRGVCVLLAIELDDDVAGAKWMANKLANLRIFADEDGRMNRSVLDIKGEVLIVSQFTLAGDCSRGHRPSFAKAAPPEISKPLFDAVLDKLRTAHELPVKTGVFGAMMQVDLTNDGPVTVIIQR